MPVTILSAQPDLSNEVVRHTERGVELDVSPPLSGLTENLKGDLYITESQVYFWSESFNTGVALWYPDIIIHAIMRQADREAIYCQLGEGIRFPAQVTESRHEDEEDEDMTTELYFIPANGESLEALYNALSQCAVLHPDADADEEEYEEEEEWYANPSDEAELSEVQRAALDHLATVFQPPVNGKKTDESDDGAFQDAMEEED
ncbi:regulator of volume decrease after cellular swelling-domain-containing protein [Umbelopsis sp. PMI_123]|nr:regulator of volume decrease after cellular swelling-domain-containing protein [Umbelopsis sp. PMI_123]